MGESGEGLTFINHQHKFVTEVDIREKISEFEFDTKYSSRKIQPVVYIKWHIKGYKLGVSTPKSHENIHMAGDNNELELLAHIPYSFFSQFYLGSTNETREVFRNRVIKDLESDGWKLIDHSMKEVISRPPQHLFHRYFDILVESI